MSEIDYLLELYREGYRFYLRESINSNSSFVCDIQDGRLIERVEGHFLVSRAYGRVQGERETDLKHEVVIVAHSEEEARARSLEYIRDIARKEWEKGSKNKNVTTKRFEDRVEEGIKLALI